jgi:hypothetical protein
LDHRTIARCLLAIFSIVQGSATLAIDLRSTHATNPLWPGHARFHLVWQNAEILLLSFLTLGLVWSSKLDRDLGFYLASTLTAIPMLSFLGALAFRGAYSGTLSDPNGIPPLQIVLLRKVRRIDLNLAAVVAGFVALAIIVAIYRS